MKNDGEQLKKEMPKSIACFRKIRPVHLGEQGLPRRVLAWFVDQQTTKVHGKERPVDSVFIAGAEWGSIIVSVFIASRLGFPIVVILVGHNHFWQHHHAWRPVRR